MLTKCIERETEREGERIKERATALFRKAQPNSSYHGAHTTLPGDFLEAAAWPRQRLEPRRTQQGLQGLGPGAAPGRSDLAVFFVPLGFGGGGGVEFQENLETVL